MFNCRSECTEGMMKKVFVTLYNIKRGKMLFSGSGQGLALMSEVVFQMSSLHV